MGYALFNSALRPKMAGTMEGNGVNKLTLTALCALVLVGCSGNQQKLEACMDKARDRFDYVATRLSSDAGCTREKLTRSECGQAVDLAKQNRLDDEDRCVKLYK